MIRIFFNVNSDVNKLDNYGRTSFYVCVSSFSIGLYKEDLKYQVSCIKVLYVVGCDMFNLVDWFKWKGFGIFLEFMRDDFNFLTWYKKNMNSLYFLMNLCRKVIQQRFSRKKKLFEQIYRFFVFFKMKIYFLRIMFYLFAYDLEFDLEFLDQVWVQLLLFFLQFGYKVCDFFALEIFVILNFYLVVNAIRFYLVDFDFGFFYYFFFILISCIKNV